VDGEGRDDAAGVGRGRGDGATARGRSGTRTVVAPRGGTYEPQVGAGRAPASTGGDTGRPGAGCRSDPPPSAMAPVTSSTTAATVPTTSATP
jgi:hypothetical protein